MNIERIQLKRIAFGLLAMITALIAWGFIPSVFPFVAPAPNDDPFFMSQPLPTTEQSLRIGIAAFLGAYVARVPFIVTTIIVYLGMTVFAFHLLTLIAEPLDPVSIVEVTARNSIGTAVGLVAAVIGADLGFRLRVAQPRNNSEPT